MKNKHITLTRLNSRNICSHCLARSVPLCPCHREMMCLRLAGWKGGNN